MSPKPTRGRPWAYFGALLGGGVSIAANWAHSRLPPVDAPADWRPEPGAVIGAIVWPFILFVAVEILARIVWPSGWSWKVVRFGGLLPVAGVAAFVSYRHLSGLLAHYGEEPLVVVIGPIAVDGLMLMATGALLAINHRTRAANTPPPATAVITAPATSVVATPVAVPSAPAPVAPIVPTPPAVAPPTVPAPPVAEPAAVAAAQPAATAPAAVTPAEPNRRPVQAAPSTTDISITASDAGKPTKVPAALLARAAQTARAHRAQTEQPITIQELADRLQVGSGMATRLLEALGPNAGKPNQPTRALNGSPVQVTR